MNDVINKPAARPLVLSLHGINTRGAWQKEKISEAFVEAGFDYIPLDYDKYLVINLLIPWKRKAKIDWFLEKYTYHARERPVSIIAHSFGTYLVARAMQKYNEIRFDKIIFCGSIVQRGYPWSTRHNNGQFNELLNDYGHQDWPAWFAQFGIIDAGPSGVRGFENNCPAVKQRAHPEFGHSHYFYKLNYTAVWIPFLRGEPPKSVATADKPLHNWHFWSTVSGVIILLILACILAWWLWPPSTAPTRVPVTISEFMEIRKSASGENIERDYLAKEVEWEGIVDSTSPRSEPPYYILKPNENSPFSDWVQAEFKRDDYRHTVTPGDRIRIRGTIKRIGANATQLHDCKILD